MVATARAGPKPIPFKQLTAENLAQAIKYCLNEDARQAALAVAEKMRIENGVKAAVESFHRHLPVKDMGCDLIPGLPATWVYTRLKKPVKMSGAAAEILVQGHRIKAEYLQLYRSKPIIIENRRWDFVTGILSGSLEFSYDVLAAFGGFYSNPRAILKNKERQRAQARASSQHAASRRPSEEDPGEGSSKDIVRLVGASAMSIPKLPGTFFKGLMVDVPVAMTEGFRNTPKLWGEKVPDHAPVTDWKSGVAVASTTFVHQLAGGLTDFLVLPVKGARREGAVGFGKGVGKGALQTFTKSGAGKCPRCRVPGISQFAYPLQRFPALLAIRVKASINPFTPPLIRRRRSLSHLPDEFRTNTSFARTVLASTLHRFWKTLTRYTSVALDPRLLVCREAQQPQP